MTTLTSSQSNVIVSIAKGNSLIVRNRSGVETVTGSSVAREDATAVLGSGAYVYGPQTSASTLTISTTGVCDYDIVAGDPTPAVEPARVVRNAATGAPASLIDPATGQPIATGSGTTFVYDATLQAAKATVDGQEVLAPKRSGSGIQAQVVPRTNTLSALLGTDGNVGEMSHPTDVPGVVVHSGVAGVEGEWIANGSIWYINASALTYNAAAGTFDAQVPKGARCIYIGVVPRGVDEASFTQLPAGWTGQVLNLLIPPQPGAIYRVIYSPKLAAEQAANRFGGLGANSTATAIGQASGALPQPNAIVGYDATSNPIFGDIVSFDVLMSTENDSAIMVSWLVKTAATATYAGGPIAY